VVPVDMVFDDVFVVGVRFVVLVEDLEVGETVLLPLLLDGVVADAETLADH
jgi:hypothetical protein